MADTKRLLELAINGLRSELVQLENELHAMSKGVTVAARTLVKPRSRRRMSAAARKAISLAQKARWAKRQTPMEKAVKKTRKLSAAGRKAISEAAKARWAKMKGK